MKGKKKFLWLASAALLAALLISGTAFAESKDAPDAPAATAEMAEAPPETQPEAQDTGETPAAEEPLTTEEPVPMESEGSTRTADDEAAEPAAEQLAGGESGTAEMTAAEVVEAAAAAGVVLADGSGEPLALASSDAVETLALPDPYFFIGGVKHEYLTFADAIDAILNTFGVLPDGGMLYVTDATYVENVTINASANPLLAGLRGIVSDNGSQYTTIDGSVTISGLLNGFTLKGFTITQGLAITDSAGTLNLMDLDVTNNPSGQGIRVGDISKYHQGAVTLKDVNSSGSSDSGAAIYATGNILVANGSFDGNSGGFGLRLRSTAGTITVKGVTARGNGSVGIYADEFKKAVTLQHIIASGNGSSGVELHDDNGTGLVRMDTIYAHNNGTYGIFVETKGAVALNRLDITESGYQGLVIYHQGSAAPITVANTSVWKSGEEGIRIESLGSITLTSVRSTENGGSGVMLLNDYPGAKGVIVVTSPATAGPAAANNFSFNTGGNGLWLESNGNITLTNLDAIGNNGNGIRVDTLGSFTINKTLPNWYNGIANNGGDGMYLEVDGNITIAHTSASSNNGCGVNLAHPALNVNVTGGLFDGNAKDGLLIQSLGNVILTDVVSARGNDWDWGDSYDYYGILINTIYGNGNVTMRSSSPSFRTFADYNSAAGLYITSKGTVTVANVHAEGNGGDGLYIYNRYGSAYKPVSVSRVESFRNDNNGLSITTGANVTLQDIRADDNESYGAYVDACAGDGMGGCSNLASVTLRGANNTFSGNDQAGLRVHTKGTITVSQIEASGNGFGGVYLHNNFEGASAPVVVGGTAQSRVNDNAGYGLAITSRGGITVRNIEVRGNYDIQTGSWIGGAVTLKNDSAGALIPVLVADAIIHNNEATGLYIRSFGAVTLQGVQASGSSIVSGEIDEDSTTNGVRERLSGTNDGDRWWFEGEDGDSYTITLTSSEFFPTLELYDQRGNLLALDGNTNEDDQAIITYYLDAGEGGWYYLYVPAYYGSGVYELTFGGTVWDWLDNGNNPNAAFSGADILTVSAVSVSSTSKVFSQFYGNNRTGLNVETYGQVSVQNALADNNYFHGAYLRAYVGNITVGNNHPVRMSSYSGNGGSGLIAEAGGTITLNNRLWINYNGEDGAILDNNILTSTPKAIKITRLTTTGNGGHGLNVNAYGPVTLTSLEANDNTQDGMNITSIGGVAMLGSNKTAGNGQDGIFIQANGPVTISGLLAEANGDRGIMVNSTGFGLGVTLRSIIARYNGGDGINIDALGVVTLDGAQCVMNGGDGAYIETYGFGATLRNSVFMANADNGIDINGPKSLLTLIEVYYLGNGNENIYYR